MEEETISDKGFVPAIGMVVRVLGTRPGFRGAVKATELQKVQDAPKAAFAVEAGLVREDMTRSELKEGRGIAKSCNFGVLYGMGRTALRQVFHRLAGAGMLEHVPRRGWRVHPFREEEMDAYLDVREVMELKALDLALPRLKRDDLKRLLADNRPAGNGGPPHVDSELHACLIEASGNRYIQDFFRRHGAYYTTLFYYAALGAAVVSDMARQHREILGSLLRGRTDRARRALSRHIRDQRPVLRKMMTRLASMPAQKWPDFESLGDVSATSPPRTLSVVGPAPLC